MASNRISPLRPAARSGRSDRSPVRNPPPSYQDIDPLLSNLSPESTLQALSSTDAVPKNEKAAHDILCKSISQVSPAERALAIRAAVAAQKLSLWYKEVQSWTWPKRTDVHLGKGFIPPSNNVASVEYYGSLPADVVMRNEKRIEEIRDGMDNLDVEELKEHVLNAHIPSRSRPSSSNSTMSVPPPLSYVQLSDFTAVITATILRALPFLSRLNSLLSTWDVRLLVLRQIPGLLRGLQLTRSALDSSMSSLRAAGPPNKDDALYSKSHFHAKHVELQTMVVSVGRRMDNILDALEGWEDSLPENWIDDLEAIESDFGTWVVEAERRAFQNEWMRQKASPQPEETNRLPDIPRRTEEPVVSAPDPVRHQGRSPLMETINEESNESSAAIAPTADHPTLESQVTSTPTKGDHAMENSLHTPSNARPEEAHTTPKVAEIPGNTTTTVADAVTTLNDKTSSQEALVPVVADVEEPACASQDKELSSAGLQTETAAPSSTDAQSEKPPVLTDSEAKGKPCLDLPSTLRNEDSVAEEPSESDKPFGSVSSEDVSQSLIESNLQTGTLVDTAQSPSVPDPVDDLPRSKDNAPPLVKVEPSAEDESATLASIIGEAATTEVPASMVSVTREPSQSARSRSASPEPSKPSIPSTNQQPATQEPSKEDVSNGSPPSKQPLESPIKLSKARPGRLSLDKDSKKSRRRRQSNDSADSLSDYTSLVSSPEMREPRTASSNGTPLLFDTPPHFHAEYPHSGLTPSHGDHTLREDRLLRLDDQKPSPNTLLKHNRTVSLPLQRFINERLDLNYEGETGLGLDNSTTGRRASVVSADLQSHSEQHGTPLSHKGKSSTPTSSIRRPAGQRVQHSHEESRKSAPSPGLKLPKIREQNKSRLSQKLPQQALRQERPVAHAATTRLRKQLAANSSVESLVSSKSGSHKKEGSLRGSSAAPTPTGSRSSTPNKQPSKQPRKPKDHLDEKISSILTTLPTRIQLVSSANRDIDGASVASVPQKTHERFRSESPQGSPSRCGTPAPSMTLTPAVSRRRHSHAPEESSVKLYHLHRGGKAPATKLFVRTVGENGERVMVRVGGGWADLGEYLREYAIHHGRRSVAETPRVEVQGLSPRVSPGYSPGNMLAPTPNNGRTTPSRPQSVLGNRPSSSLAVRKTRRSSNVSDITDFRATRAASAGEMLNISFSSMSASSRRLSMSSNNSFGGTSLASEVHNGSSAHSPATTIAAGSARSAPLGLAGPRSRHVAISPESEAWVEDVLGQARRSASMKTSKFHIPPPERDTAPPLPKISSLPKSRSVSDMGSAGTSKRVALRGLGNRIT
ncbi:hypothetical protein ASPWEDRAFT_48640 [Aspergillus wentii DTO 134E9]|uniref:GAR domain-containing protein n=1 Tax=Aspergillus wentii DTO 134E9 TaxID=1073089 RepID=A0A1L9RUA3_ASPWE|nr:uncharacterized protein ASPWEDRAFT_48640 [Aspergillus wentii DTO 134E9]OJJ38397.1 hypothetical protein ASPWEDRAFT_48640 [Aspergillus wentii DTO 134E9]